MPSHLLVERALALVPEGDEFLPLSDAVIGSSITDREKRWARSGVYATVGKRMVDPKRLAELVPGLVEKAQRRLNELYTLVVTALERQHAGDPAAAARTLVQAGELEEANRSLEKAEKIYRLALEIARDLRDKAPHVLALRRLGRVMRTAGRLNEAWSWYEQSYQLSLDQMDAPGQVIACQGLGNICGDRGQRDLARAWYERGLRLTRGLEDPSLLWPFYINLSLLARMSGSYEEAERLVARAKQLIEEAGGGSAMLFWYNGRGLLLLEQGEAAAAELTYREALEQVEDPFWELTLRVNLGQSLVAQGRLFEAEEEARTAEEIGIFNHLIPDLIDVYLLLGSISAARGDEEGFVFYEQALHVWRERSLPQLKEAAIYRGYGVLASACGGVPEAAAYLGRAREIYTTLGLTRERDAVQQEMVGLSAETPE